LSAEPDLDFIARALPAFVTEAREQIAMSEQLLLQLEDQPGNRELLDALFRCAHTVKGSAGIFGLDAVVGFTHHVETLLDQVREGAVALTPALSTLLLQCNDEILALVYAAQDTASRGAEGDADARAGDRADVRADLVRQLQDASGEPVLGPAPGTTPSSTEPLPAAPRRWHLEAAFGADTFRNGMDPQAILAYLRGLGTLPRLHCRVDGIPPLDAIDPESCHLAFELTLETAASQQEIEAAFSFVQDDCALQLRCEGERPATSTTSAPAAAAEPAATRSRGNASALPGEDTRIIRVHADRLDAVINLLGELVVAGAGAALMARQTKHRGLVEANLLMTRLIEEIRNGTLQLRMVPIGETFARFRRVVRDTATELGKDVHLDIQGSETELDKSVVERIADPLIHLVRNGLDHGLETPAERLAAGKPAQGRLLLSACHEAGGITIRIEDDGRGIRRDKVLQRAWERGLVPPGVRPPDAEILNLIFEPGFSTADKITNLSGRGVGMDVVRRNIQALRGAVTLHSVEGQGSRIDIRLPLTLAIIDGFLVGVGSSRFIFPLESVVEVIENRSAATVADARGRCVVELRGQTLPVVSLRALYALKSPPPERTSVVVLQAGDKRLGVLVDTLLGQHQTVIKPLGRMFGSLRGMSGSSILGNGEVALIFDVPALARMAAEPHTPVPHPRRDTPAAQPATQGNTP